MKAENKSITTNSIFYVIYNLLNVIFPLLTGIYVARILLPENIGQVEIARNYAQYFLILSFLGIPTYGIREVSKRRNNREELSKLYSELMVFNSISTLLCSIVFYFSVLVIPHYSEIKILCFIAGLSIILNLFNHEWLFSGLEEFKFISLRNIAFKVLCFIALVLFVRDTDDLIAYAFISIFGTAGNYLLNIIKARKIVDFSFKNISLKEHLKPVFMLLAVNVAIEIYSLVDITMLGFLCDEQTVTFYSYGMRIFRIFLSIVNSFTMVLVPRLALYYKENKQEEFNSILSKTFRVILLISIPMVIGIFFVSTFVITFLYGDTYSLSASVLKILSMILVISPIGYLLGSRILLVTGNENKMIIPVACGAVTNVIINYLLIPIYGAIGAAIASVIGEIVVMTVFILFGCSKYKLINIRRNLMKQFVAIIFMSALLVGMSLLPISAALITILQIVLGVISYFGILLLLREDIVIELLNKFVRKLKHE